jgi:hypothetical protein
MASCEKCWTEAHGDAERYLRLVEDRDASGHACTPEEQAGPDAKVCPSCGRRAVHQLCRVCMACGREL